MQVTLFLADSLSVVDSFLILINTPWFSESVGQADEAAAEGRSSTIE